LTVQAGQEDSDAMAKSSRTTNLDLSARTELGNTVYCDDVNLDDPIRSINILELLNRDEDEDNDADDSIPTPCQRLVTKSTFRTGDRLGMAAASERTRLTIQANVTNTEEPGVIAVKGVHTQCLQSPAMSGESRKRLRQDPQEHAITKTTDKKTKKRSYTTTAILTSIRQKTLTDYVTVLRQPGDARIEHGGSSRQSDNDSLLCVVPVCDECHDSIGSETHFATAEDSHLIKRIRTDPQRARSAASSNSLEYDKRVAFS